MLSDSRNRKGSGRLTRSADFSRVYRQGRSVQHRLLVCYAFKRPESIPVVEHEELAYRVGITISKKVGGAVARNRLKRQLRESIAAAGFKLPGHDVVIVARPGIIEAVENNGFSWLEQTVDEQLSRLTQSEKTSS